MLCLPVNIYTFFLITLPVEHRAMIVKSVLLITTCHINYWAELTLVLCSVFSQYNGPSTKTASTLSQCFSKKSPLPSSYANHEKDFTLLNRGHKPAVLPSGKNQTAPFQLWAESQGFFPGTLWDSPEHTTALWSSLVETLVLWVNIICHLLNFNNVLSTFREQGLGANPDQNAGHITKASFQVMLSSKNSGGIEEKHLCSWIMAPVRGPSGKQRYKKMWTRSFSWGTRTKIVTF